MQTYVALLRGVNVGKNLLKMERLRQLLPDLGFKNVTTYLQSGNVVLQAEGSPSSVSSAIEQKLAGETRLPVTVLVRTPAELKSIIARNPFLKEKGVDRSKLHVTFLASPGGKDALKRLSALNAGADQFRLSGKEVYLYCPNGYGISKLSNNALEKALSVKATTRNWNTVNKLYAIASKSF
ncbi:MAG: DUF1697 domain-containing protein [Acidobacteriia bacterium]|nr:DUF1697 domain-containing protein [Terriglobia bacterium]